MEALKKKLQESGAWDQLTRTVLTVIRDKPDKALEVFEALATTAKNGKPQTEMDQKQKNKAIEALTSMANLYKAPPPPKGPEGEEPEPEAAPEEMPHIPDLMYNASAFNMAGVNFGEGEVYNISLSIHDFAIEQAKAGSAFKSIRFVGKILGTKADYYVIECGKDDWPEPAEDAPKLAEPMGQGTNQYQYWVSNEAGHGAAWRCLPPTTPEQLATAKRVRKFFTGDLDAVVKGYPYFPWKEAGYLRAQLAEITHATTVSPKGVWVEEAEAEEPKPIQLNTNYAPPSSASELLSLDMWTHHRPYIMPGLGMCVPPEPEDGDEEKKVRNPQKLLETVAKDLRSRGEWRTSLSTSLGVRPQFDSNAVACAQSLLWPGAYCIVKGTTIVNIYVGYGHIRLDQPYARPSPPSVASEFKLPGEQEDAIKAPAEENREEEKKEEEKGE